APAGDVEGDLAATKFADHKVVTYLTRDKDTAFGWQLQPVLPAAPDARPRDFLILVDTTASQGRGPLMVAQKLAAALVGQLKDDDRAALWTVNLEPKKLSGFEPKD